LFFRDVTVLLVTAIEPVLQVLDQAGRETVLADFRRLFGDLFEFGIIEAIVLAAGIIVGIIRRIDAKNIEIAGTIFRVQSAGRDRSKVCVVREGPVAQAGQQGRKPPNVSSQIRPWALDLGLHRPKDGASVQLPAKCPV
jgi:hypothetical protein